VPPAEAEAEAEADDVDEAGLAPPLLPPAPELEVEPLPDADVLLDGASLTKCILDK